jgi:hypothetical protein
VVIAVFYATVTDATVGGAWRTPETTGGAVFGGDVRGLWADFGTGGYGDIARGGKEVPSFGWFGGQHVEIAREDLTVRERCEGPVPLDQRLMLL